MCSLERVLIYADSARVGVCPVSQPQRVRDHGHVQLDFLANSKRSDALSVALFFFSHPPPRLDLYIKILVIP